MVDGHKNSKGQQFRERVPYWGDIISKYDINFFSENQAGFFVVHISQNKLCLVEKSNTGHNQSGIVCFHKEYTSLVWVWTSLPVKLKLCFKFLLFTSSKYEISLQPMIYILSSMWLSRHNWVLHTWNSVITWFSWPVS